MLNKVSLFWRVFFYYKFRVVDDFFFVYFHFLCNSQREMSVTEYIKPYNTRIKFETWRDPKLLVGTVSEVTYCNTTKCFLTA
jgi:hypothetical protein